MGSKKARGEKDIYYSSSHNIRSMLSEKQLRLIVIAILEKFISPLPSEILIEELETLIKNYINQKLSQNLSQNKKEQ